MKNPIFAVIDTNVLVSALISKNPKSPTVTVLEHVFNQKIIPAYNNDIIKEYLDVLSRPKFKFNKTDVKNVIHAFRVLGVLMNSTTYPKNMPDPKDRVFYEVSLTGESYLVTGNKKHFPCTPKVVSPTEMVEIIDSLE